jgi:hypothetical protein
VTDRRQTRLLVREGAPQRQHSNFQTEYNTWSRVPEWTWHHDILTDWPSVVTWLWLWLKCHRIQETGDYEWSERPHGYLCHFPKVIVPLIFELFKKFFRTKLFMVVFHLALFWGFLQFTPKFFSDFHWSGAQQWVADWRMSVLSKLSETFDLHGHNVFKRCFPFRYSISTSLDLRMLYRVFYLYLKMSL